MTQGDLSLDENGRTGAGALQALLVQVGPFGFYHRYVLALLLVPNLLAAMYSLNYVFVADPIVFRCLVSECEGDTSEYQNKSALTLSLKMNSDAACGQYSPLNGSKATCDQVRFHQNRTQSCEFFTYESADSLFAEFQLGCGELTRNLVVTLRNWALPLALLLNGYVTDLWGRRTAFCIFSGMIGTLGIVKALSYNYQMYLTMEFFEVALGTGFNSAGYLILVELVRPSLRAAFACSTGIAYGLGGILFALAAWRVHYWRHLLLVTYPFALLLPLYWKLLDESPHWLHAQARISDAIAVLRKVASWNKVPVNEELMQNLEGCTASEVSLHFAHPLNPWLRAMRSRVLVCRFAVCSCCWLAIAFIQYGLAVDSVPLSTDKYTNFALNMFMEVVGSVLVMMSLERFGRRWSIFATFMVCGVAFIFPHFVSHNGSGIGLFFVGKLVTIFAYNSMRLFTVELFPTEVRGSALAACLLLRHIGSVSAPHTQLTNVYAQTTVYCAWAAGAALATLVAPETRRMPLPQSMRDNCFHSK